MSMSILEQYLDSFGLMRGEYSTYTRATLGALVGAFVVQKLQPPNMYKDGVAKPWSLVSKDMNATPLPWFAVPIFGAFLMGVVI